MNEIFEKWADVLSWELQCTMLDLRDRMENNGDDWASTAGIPDRVLDELEQLSLIERKAIGSAAEFTSLGSNIVNYCTC
jgi:hypothetical protein